MTLEHPDDLNATLTTAEAVLRWGLGTFHPNIVFASSFGAEDVVVIHFLANINPKARIVTLDTGRLHGETYEVIERVRERYGVEIESYFPDRQKVEALERAKGFYSFRTSVENRKECCGIRKIEPLKRALAGAKAWITGLRREQSVTRGGVERIELDAGNGGIYKLNPIADWTHDQVWDYIRQHDLPYNRLHDRGFPSIGCEPCTRAIEPGEDVRAGRWWWETPETKECGLHKAKVLA